MMEKYQGKHYLVMNWDHQFWNRESETWCEHRAQGTTYLVQTLPITIGEAHLDIDSEAICYIDDDNDIVAGAVER